MNYSEKLPESESSDPEILSQREGSTYLEAEALSAHPHSSGTGMEADAAQTRCSSLGTGSGKPGLTAAQPKAPQEGVLCTDTEFFFLLVLQLCRSQLRDCVNGELKQTGAHHRSRVSDKLTN